MRFWPDRGDALARVRAIAKLTLGVEEEPPKWRDLNRCGRRVTMKRYGLLGARGRGGRPAQPSRIAEQRQARPVFAARAAAADDSNGGDDS